MKKAFFLSVAMVSGCVEPPSISTANIATSPQHSVDWEYQNRHNDGYGPACEYSGRFTINPRCTNSAQPKTIVWGDSIAMYWTTALLETEKYKSGIAQATMSTCGPLLDIAPVYTEYFDEKWSRKCLEFNDSVFEYIKNTSSISDVILSGIFIYYVEAGQYLLGKKGRESQGVDVAEKYLLSTIDRIKHLGKTVTIIAPAPITNFDAGACYEQKYPHVLNAQPSDCLLNADDYRNENRAVIELLSRIEKQASIKVIWPSEILCDDAVCRTNIGGVPLYRDRTHLSYAGARILGKSLAL